MVAVATAALGGCGQGNAPSASASQPARRGRDGHHAGRGRHTGRGRHRRPHDDEQPVTLGVRHAGRGEGHRQADLRAGTHGRDRVGDRSRRRDSGLRQPGRAGGGPGRRPCRRHLAAHPRGRPGNRGQLHLRRCRRGRRQGRDHPLPVRRRTRDHHADDDGEGREHLPARRPRRRRSGDAQRRGPAAHPLHEHLRRRPAVHEEPLPGSGDAAARGPEPHVRERERDRPAAGGRGWRGHLRPWRPPQDRQLAVRGQSLRQHRPRSRRRRGPGAEPVQGPARVRRRQHLRERACAPTAARSAASASPGRSSTASSATTRRSGAAPTPPGRDAGRWQRRGDLQRRQHDDAADRGLRHRAEQRPRRAAVPSSS